MDEPQLKHVDPQFVDRSLNSYMQRIFSFFYNTVFVTLFCIIYIIFTLILAVLLMGIGISWAYTVLLTLGPLVIILVMSLQTYRGKQTPGNKTMGMIVMNDNGSPLSFGKSVLRNLLFIMLALPLGFGFIWTLFDPQGKGIHDRLLKTRLAIAPDAGRFRVPIFQFTIFILSIFCILLFIPPFAVLINVWPSPDMLLIPLFILIFITPITFVLSLVAQWFARKDQLGKKIAKTSVTISVIAGVCVFLLAITIPSNLFLRKVYDANECEDDIMEIGTAMEKYVHDHGTYPENLDALVYDKYLTAMPRFRNSEQYRYALGFHATDTVFIILCPSPQWLLKDRGLLPVARVKEMKYLEGQGLIVTTD